MQPQQKYRLGTIYKITGGVGGGLNRFYRRLTSPSSSAVVHNRSLVLVSLINIYIFISITLNESIFLDLHHFPMKNIKSHDLEAMPKGGATPNQPVTLFVYFG